MFKMKKSIAALLVIALALLFGCTKDMEESSSLADPLTASERQLGEVTVIFSSDAASHIKSDGGITVGKIASYKQLLESQGKDVILLDTGNSLYSTSNSVGDKGETGAKILTLCGYSCSGLSQKDFSLSLDALKSIQADGETQFLSSNCILKDSNTPFSKGGIIINKGNGKIGILGFSPIETNNTVDIETKNKAVFENDVKILQTLVDNLHNNGADYIIALCSLSDKDELSPSFISENIDGIDLIIGEGNSNPSTNAYHKGNSFVVFADSTMKSLGTVEIDMSKKSSGVKAFTHDSSVFSNLSDTLDLSFVEENINNAQINGENILCTVVNQKLFEKINEETAVGTLTADSMRPLTGAAAAMVKWNTIKNFNLNGSLAQKEIKDAFDSESDVISTSLLGEQIENLLNKSVENYPDFSDEFLITSGISYTIEKTDDKASVKNTTINGHKIEKEKNYLIALDSSILKSNNYSDIADNSDETVFIPLNQAVERYLSALSKRGIITLSVPKMITIEEFSQFPAEADDKQQQESESSEQSEEEPVEEPKKAEEDKYYVVVLGDTLTKISSKLYGTINYWEDIFNLNRDILKSSDDIRVGMKLKLP